MSQLDELLRPSLDDSESEATTIYSTTVGYLSAFFGGPVGAAVIAILNAHRLNRLKRDWWILPLALGVVMAEVAWLLLGGGKEWLAQVWGRSTSFITSVLGLALFALSYRIHRRYYRNMQLLDVTPPPGWRVGFLAIAAGWAFTMLAGMLTGMLGAMWKTQ